MNAFMNELFMNCFTQQNEMKENIKLEASEPNF